jgi:hypothetical protein
MKKIYLLLFVSFYSMIGFGQNLSTVDFVCNPNPLNINNENLKSASVILSEVVYLRTNTCGNYWWGNSNAATLDATFGAGNWSRADIETVNINNLLSESVKFIFMDGSNCGTCEFADFVASNRTNLESWVSNGGVLFLNAAGNECSGTKEMILGVSLQYGNSAYGYSADLSHPIFQGPKLPALADVYYGSSWSHEYITGTGLTVIMKDDSNRPTLAEKEHGAGKVLFGGLTLEVFETWTPNTEVMNLYSNILAYAYNSKSNKEVVCNPIDINLDVDGSYKLDSLDMIELTGVTPDSLSTFDDMKIFAYPDTFTTANIEWPVFVRVTQYDGRYEKKRCWSMVTVHDAMPPTVVGNDIEVMLDSAGLAVITKEQVTDSATFDVSGIVSTSIDKDTFTCENIGENWVMLSATDIYGNVGTDSVLVTVSAGLPNLDSIQDINIALATGVCETAVEYPIPVFTQICGISATQTAGLGRDAMFPVGTTTEAWTIIDHKGDTTLVSFDVIITSSNAFPSFSEIDSITVGDTLTTVNIAVSGISAGIDCMPQTVTVIAETENSELIDSLTVAYTEGDTTGTVIVNLVPEMTGTANIKVTVTDSEGASIFRNFDIVVNAVPKSSPEKEGQIATFVWTKEIEMGINMYPNPTQDMVTVDIRNYNASQAEVAVFNLTGSEVIRKTYPAGETIRFSMNEQVSGVYLVKMNIDGNHIIKKLVVDRK